MGFLILGSVFLYILNWTFWQIKDFFGKEHSRNKISSIVPRMRVTIDEMNRKDITYEQIETQLFIYLKIFQKEKASFHALPCDLSQFGFHTIYKVKSPLILNFENDDDDDDISALNNMEDYFSVRVTPAVRLFFIMFQKKANIIYVKDDIAKIERHSANEYILINNHIKNSLICKYDDDDDDVIVLIEMRTSLFV
jgi:hypothetical protein